MQQIVLQFIDVNNNVFVNTGRILSYFNQFFVKYLNSMQYCEDLDKGFLFIFRDFDAFHYRTQPISPNLLEKPSPKLFPGVNIFKFFLVSKQNFPSEGVDVHIKVIAGDPEQIFPRIHGFLMSIDERIIITQISSNTINFHTSTHEIIQKYTNSLFNRFYLRNN